MGDSELKQGDPCPECQRPLDALAYHGLRAATEQTGPAQKHFVICQPPNGCGWNDRVHIRGV